jgi:hypothetical protein
MNYLNKIFLISFFFILLKAENISQNINYVLPNLPYNKQGIADRVFKSLDKRYIIFTKDMGIDFQKFNFYWENVENILPSSPTQMICPKGYFLFPSNKKQKKLLKIHKYHCYKKAFVDNWQKIFNKNKQYGIIIAVVLWTTPSMYRDPGCKGFYFPLLRKYLKEGCYPTASHYDDYEDWIRFVSYHFGKYIDHYIVWNEVESTDWADTSTLKYPKKKMIKNLKFHMERSFSIYVELLKRTIKAVNEIDNKCMNIKGKCNNLVYVSLDRDWYSRKPVIYKDKKEVIHIKWRNMNLLDYIWNKLGLNYNWSIAVHPYGDVYKKLKNGLTFSTLKDLSAYQKAHIESLKTDNRPWRAYPQSIIYASEQNAGKNIKADDWKRKAQFICESYDIAMRMPELIAITDNHFQDNTCYKKATKYTMLPPTVKLDLSNADKYETFQAYLSTNPEVWGKRNDHYCCRVFRLGCIKY